MRLFRETSVRPRAELSASTHQAYGFAYDKPASGGRFTQVDPIGMRSTNLSSPQTLNLYAYCTNDPINHTDPSGLGFISFLKKIFKRVVHAAIAAAVAFIFTYIRTGSWQISLGVAIGTFVNTFLQGPPGYKPGFGTAPTFPVGAGRPALHQILQGTILSRLFPSPQSYLRWVNGFTAPLNPQNQKLPDCAKNFLSQFYGYGKALLDAITFTTNGIPSYVPIKARAFTLGDHIYFDFNEFNPGDGISDDEMVLLAHEVTHSRQYRRYGKKRFSVSYLWQSGTMGAAGYYWGGHWLGPTLAFHMSYYGNKYEQEAGVEGAFIGRQIERFGQPCRK